MANTIGWGQAAVNNTIDWGKGKTNNSIGWGSIYSISPYGETDIVGTLPVDADAQLFITNAAITDTIQKAAIDKLVTDLKGYGIWTKMKALYPFVGGTSSQHKYNLKDPRDLNAAFRLVFNGGWTHSSTGALPNGTNSWADTFFFNGGANNSWTSKDNANMSYYSRTDNNFQQIEIGLYQGATNNNNGFATRYLSNQSFYTLSIAGNSGTLNTVNTDGRGFYSANRNAVNTLNGWKNGVKQGQVASTSFTGNGALSYPLACVNEDGAKVAYSSKECAFASFGDGLTDTEAANYYTAVQTFQTTLSRNV